MRNETLLHEEIAKGFEQLDGVKKGTDEYEKIVTAQTKLLDKAIEIDRLNFEHDEKLKEQELKEKELEVEKKDRTIKNILTGISVGGGLITTWHWARKSLQFEETGTVTTAVGRNFINKAINFLKK